MAPTIIIEEIPNYLILGCLQFIDSVVSKLLYHALQAQSKCGCNNAVHNILLSVMPKKATFLYKNFNLAFTFLTTVIPIDELVMSCSKVRPRYLTLDLASTLTPLQEIIILLAFANWFLDANKILSVPK